MTQTQHEMSPTQEHLLQLILEIDSICRKYDIQYFLDYGSALGAIRHEGFIPWDDDMDITMTEDNYYKWVEACKKELDNKTRTYRDNRIDPEYPTVFGHYVDLESFRVSGAQEFWKPVCGQSIDVFSLIPLPGDPVKKQKAIDRYYAYDEYSNGSYRHSRYETPERYRLYKKYTFWGHIIGKRNMLKILQKKIFHKHYADCDTYICSSARNPNNGPSPLVPKKSYDTVHMADFEGHKLPIPGGYVELMNIYYEDTYCMLPDEKRVHSKQSDTDLTCFDYYDDYMRLLDTSHMLSDMQHYKNTEEEEGLRYTALSRETLYRVAEYQVLLAKRRLARSGQKLSDLLDPTDKDKLAVLDDIFSHYYSVQMHKSMRLWQVYIDLDEDMLYAALFNLIYGREDYYTVAKIIQLRQKEGKSIDGRIAELWDIILTSRKIKSSVIYGDDDTAAKYIEYGRKKYPYVRDLAICEMEYKVRKASNEKEYAECDRLIEGLIDEHPDDDNCIKAQGDLAYKRGDLEKAEQYYTWVNEHSRNGMLMLDIARKMRKAND